MGVSNHNLDALEQQRLALEDNILQLQKSLYHWRTWEAEYDSLQEDMRNLNDGATAEDFLSVGREYGGTLVNEEEMQVIIGGTQGGTRSRGQVVDLLGRRIDYVKQNVATMEKKLRVAEDQLYALDSKDQLPAEGQPDFPMTEIMEELDEDGRVISSSVNTPGDQAPQLLDVLKKAGVTYIPNTAGKDEGNAADTDVNTSLDHEGDTKQDIVSDSLETAPQTNGATERADVDFNRPVSLVTEEDRKEPPVTHVDEPAEDAQLRREMLQYGIDEVGAIVAELEVDEDASDVSIDEDYDYDTENDEDEDQFGRSYPVLTEDYHQQMRELEAKLNARGMWNMGKDSESLPAEVKQELDQPLPDTDGAEAPVEDKKPKKRVAFAEDLDIAPTPEPPAAEKKTLPHQSDVEMLSESIVERSENPQQACAPVADRPKKVSRFRSARSTTTGGATNDSSTTESTISSTFQLAEARPRKQTNATPSTEPPPLFPATPKDPKPFSTPITDDIQTPSAPRPPEGKIFADNLVERDIIPGAASAPGPDELDEEIHRREIDSEFYKMRNRMVHQNGFLDTEEQEVPIETDDPPKRVSKFRAARMK